MRLFVVGGGGREHAIVKKLLDSPSVEHIYVAPGNAGIEQEHNVSCVPLAVTDVKLLRDFALSESIDLTIVGPETSLSLGITDIFEDAGLRCFGPSFSASQLETSKSFAKDFFHRYDIPTARYACFDNEEEAFKYLDTLQAPYVIKADGLSAGKGVIIAENLQQAQQAVHTFLHGSRFGEAGRKIVIEEYVLGVELSYIVIISGGQVLPLASSQDHKRRDDGNHGPNTGGMGAISPAPSINPDLEEKIQKTVVSPMLNGLRREALDYCGFMYFGIMINPQGEPKVLEINCRLGDPEAQVILPRMQTDFAELCYQACDRKLPSQPLQWDRRTAVGVVMTAKGYPLEYPKGELITGLDTKLPKACYIFHANTKYHMGQYVTNGGRVLCVTALGNDSEAARCSAYAIVSNLCWEHCFYRKDIGWQSYFQKV